jgi:hypothetical protein
MSSLPALSSMNRLRPNVAGECDNPPEVQPHRFDHPVDALAARLDAFELELLVKLQSIESPEPSPAPRLSVGEILRIVVSTALACIAVMLAGVWIWRH